MTLQEALLAVMLRLPGPDSREPPEQREARLGTIAQAVAEVAQEPPPEGWRGGRLELAAALTQNSYEEGQRWHPDVHSGKRRGDQGRAACLNQLWPHYVRLPRPDWLATMGTDLESTKRCMRAAAAWFGYHFGRCVQPWMGVEVRLARVFTAYGTATGTCKPNGRAWALKRARGAAWREGELRFMLSQGREVEA